MSVLALGLGMAQLLAAGAIVAVALGAGVAMTVHGERRRLIMLPRSAPRGRLSAQTLALMERGSD
ncbi:hypothetical protein K7957_13955 [Sphingomonas yunnanensis]|uniref:hypothetical protein n=1 Tax=Sphingomonas yunnanensis TaxID=310400 RepID=UPI001CA713C6|nr:hypothetical protein [Sphingomonas yunnanensis]MBY9064042.1 hypothetical protein [Sphingomonas yunnanensis]